MVKSCLDKLQNLYFITALLEDKSSEWDFIKEKLNKVIALAEKQCANEVLKDNYIEVLSSNLLQSVKNDDLTKASSYLLEIANNLQEKARIHVINNGFKILRLIISFSFILSTLIILLYSTINIYQWLINLFILGASIASAALISYGATNIILLCISIFDTLNVLLFNDAALLISQIIITIVSIINFILDRNVKKIYYASSIPT